MGTDSTIEHPVVFFDGYCNFCDGSVQFIIKRDKSRYFRFASLQSDFAQNQLGEKAGTFSGDPETLVLLSDDRILIKSDAIFEIARHLPSPWSWLNTGRFLPRGFRDWVYSLVARNRYRWFGKKDACMVPTPAVRSLFLDQ